MADAFNGSWVLDLAKSQDTDALLTAQGVGWLKRKALNGLAQTMTVTISGDQLKLKQETSLNTNEFTVTLGGAAVDYQDDLSGKPAKRSAHLDGDKLVVVTDNADGTLTVVRTVQGNVLTAVITFKAKSNGADTVCTRYFNKK